MMKNAEAATAYGLSTAQDVVHALARGAGIDDALDLVVERVCLALHPTEVMILLLQDGRLLLRAGRGIEGVHLPRLALADGASVEDWVVQHDAPLFVPDVARESRFSLAAPRPGRVAALAAVPIYAAGTPIGVLEVGGEQGADFAANALLITTMADIVGLVLEHTQAVRQACDDAAREFLHDIRHDLRSPLTAIYGYAQLLRRRAVREGRDADVQAAATIMDQVQRMTAMLDALRDASLAEEELQAAQG